MIYLAAIITFGYFDRFQIAAVVLLVVPALVHHTADFLTWQFNTLLLNKNILV
jgi:hypothetical protein